MEEHRDKRVEGPREGQGYQTQSRHSVWNLYLKENFKNEIFLVDEILIIQS